MFSNCAIEFLTNIIYFGSNKHNVTTNLLHDIAINIRCRLKTHVRHQRTGSHNTCFNTIVNVIFYCLFVNNSFYGSKLTVTKVCIA